MNRSLRAGLAAALIVIVAAACGKKGPPLAPFVRVPAPVANATGQRIGGDIYLSFPVPSINVDGQQPADIGSLEVYAITAVRPPETEEQRELATLIATLPVRPILPELPPSADGTPLPPIPLPPGIDRAAPAVVKEAVTADTLVPVPLPPKPGEVPPEDEEDAETAFGPLVAPAPSELRQRHYFVVAISPRGRKAPPSTPIAVPLETGSSATAAPQVTYTESRITVTWTPSPDARSSTFLIPPVVPPVPTPATEPPAAAAPGPPDVPGKPPARAMPPLPAKSLGFNSEATLYHLYEVAPALEEENPFALTLPVPLTPQPLAVTEHIIKGVTFGVERCFAVRPVDRVFGVVVQGPASPVTCITPADTFPPAAPRSLEAIAGPGVISLIWDPNSESDLAGYLVLRGEAPGDTLQAITTEPWTTTTYRDETVRPGTRYVYAVVAVDRATPQNVSAQSDRIEETARQ